MDMAQTINMAEMAMSKVRLTTLSTDDSFEGVCLLF
jgi:hypothetical protein